MSNDCVSKIEFITHNAAVRERVIAIIKGVDKYAYDDTLESFIESNTETTNDVTVVWYTEKWGPTDEAYAEIAGIDGVTHFEALFWEPGNGFMAFANKMGTFEVQINGRETYESVLGQSIVKAFDIDIDEWCAVEDDEDDE